MGKWEKVVDCGGNDLQKGRSMFSGEYNHSIDEKGRLIIPSKFRYELGEKFVLTRGLDGCICVYPMGEWEAFETKLRSLPLTNSNARKVIRFLIGGAENCSLDKSGRVLVPAALREYANLSKDVVITGTLERIEIWDKAKWEEACSFDDVEAIAESISDCGIMI